MPERLGKWLVAGPPLAYLVVFFAIPTLIMVLASFRTPGEFGGLAPLVDEAGKLDLNLDSYVRFFTESVYAEVFVKSVGYALVTTLACLALAYPLAALIARSPKRYRDLLLLLVILPFWSNFLIRVYAWMIILGPQAALARGVNGVLAALGFEPVALLFSAFAVLVVPRLRAPAVHGAAALREPREARRRRCSTPRRISAPTRGSASGASRSRCRCPASTPAPRWCSFRRSASSRFPTSSAGPTTA